MRKSGEGNNIWFQATPAMRGPTRSVGGGDAVPAPATGGLVQRVAAARCQGGRLRLAGPLLVGVGGRAQGWVGPKKKIENTRKKNAKECAETRTFGKFETMNKKCEIFFTKMRSSAKDKKNST